MKPPLKCHGCQLLSMAGQTIRTSNGNPYCDACYPAADRKDRASREAARLRRFATYLETIAENVEKLGGGG